jgi:hypothetical protein
VLFDIGSAIWDVVDIVKNPASGWAWGSLGADVVCAFVPFVAGGGAAVRGAKLGTKAVNAVDNASDAAKAIDRTHDYARTIDKAWDVGSITNPVPSRLARVVDARFAARPRLGFPGASDVFVTAADDIAGITNSTDLARRLTMLDNTGALRRGPFAVLQFDTPAMGLASPIRRTNPGFVGSGRTADGAREFVLPNLRTNVLGNLTVRMVP